MYYKYKKLEKQCCPIINAVERDCCCGDEEGTAHKLLLLCASNSCNVLINCHIHQMHGIDIQTSVILFHHHFSLGDRYVCYIYTSNINNALCHDPHRLIMYNYNSNLVSCIISRKLFIIETPFFFEYLGYRLLNQKKILKKSLLVRVFHAYFHDHKYGLI